LQIVDQDDLIRHQARPGISRLRDSMETQNVRVQLKLFMGECTYADISDRAWLSRFLGFVTDGELLAFGAPSAPEAGESPLKKLKIKHEQDLAPLDDDVGRRVDSRTAQLLALELSHTEPRDRRSREDARRIRDALIEVNALTSTGCLLPEALHLARNVSWNRIMLDGVDKDKLIQALKLRVEMKHLHAQTEEVVQALVAMRGKLGHYERSDMAKLLNGVFL
jgi:hypothetical protein